MYRRTVRLTGRNWPSSNQRRNKNSWKTISRQKRVKTRFKTKPTKVLRNVKSQVNGPTCKKKKPRIFSYMYIPGIIILKNHWSPAQFKTVTCLRHLWLSASLSSHTFWLGASDVMTEGDWRWAVTLDQVLCVDFNWPRPSVEKRFI